MRRSATYRIGMVAHYHGVSTSYLDPSTTHPYLCQILKEDLQRKIMGHDLRRIAACLVFLTSTWLGRAGLVGFSLRGRRRLDVDRVRLVL
jgi:hypothetical protein